MSGGFTVAGERTTAQITSAPSRAARSQRHLALVSVALVGAAVLGWYYWRLATTVVTPAGNANAAARSSAASDMRLPPLNLAAVRAPGSAAADGATVAAVPVLAPADTESRGLDRRYPDPSATSPTTSPLLVRAAPAGVPEPPRQAGSADDADRAVVAAGLVDETGASRHQPVNRLAASLEPTTTVPVEARIVPSRRWLLPKGAFLDCTLQTAIDSTLPGMATCMLAADVFGADGRVVLLDRGTQLVGETNAEVRAGQSRVAVLWAEARTPSGVVVALASPGTDALGRAGLPGGVDTHFGARFGAAVLLSLIDSAAAAVVSRQQGSGAVVYSAQGSRDVATEALRGTIGIPPTVRVLPGARIEVLVARDIDFRSVYRLVANGAR